MSLALASRVLVRHRYAEDRHLPSRGEIILVPLSEDLFGPGSIIDNRNLPSRRTQRNFHHAVVLKAALDLYEHAISFTVLPMPAYSATDPTTGLSSTSWLLSQPDDFQLQHIPVPYEQSQPQPPFSTPARFGDPLEAGGWKDRKPSWVLAVPQVTENTTTFKCFEPPVKLSEDELRRLREYCGLSPSPVTTMSSVPGGGSHPQQLGESNNPGAGSPAGGSLAFQALYANNAVKQGFASLDQPSMILDSGSDDDDDDDDWEDNMDPVTFARYYATSNPHLARIVQEHDQKMREGLNEGITNWAKGVQSVTFKGDVS